MTTFILILQALLQQIGWDVFAHSSHSPDLASSNYYLFARLEEALVGRQRSFKSPPILSYGKWREMIIRPVHKNSSPSTVNAI